MKKNSCERGCRVFSRQGTVQFCIVCGQQEGKK
jgi:hypothetical protein